MPRHEGWRNYETWSVALHINNNQDSYHYWRRRAVQLLRGRETRLALADELKDQFESEAPDLGPTCYADLLNAGLGEVDWLEIADSLLRR